MRVRGCLPAWAWRKAPRPARSRGSPAGRLAQHLCDLVLMPTPHALQVYRDGLVKFRLAEIGGRRKRPMRPAALLTAQSSRPKRSTAAITARSTCAGTDTSVDHLQA